MGDEPTLEDLNRRLAEIQDRLLELDPDDFAARHGLHTDRDHLRALARHSQSDRDTHRSSEELRAELKARQAALEEIKKGTVNTGGMAGGGRGGSGSYEGPLDGMKINDAIRTAQGTDQLLRRITHLESILQERGEL